MPNLEVDERGLSSLNRFFDVLEYLDSMTREVSIQQVSASLNINKTTVYRILSTMCQRGYAYQNPESRKYALSLSFYHIGFRTRNKMPISQLLSPYYPSMDQLRDKYDESINVGMLDMHNRSGIKLVNIVSVKSQYMLQRFNRDIGSMPAHTSATGKCLMAYAPKSFIDQYRKNKLEVSTFYTISEWDALDDEMALIRKRGYSLCRDEHEIGISCIAVPIFAVGEEKVHAAISVSGETNRICRLDEREVVADLKALAAQMSKAF